MEIEDNKTGNSANLDKWFRQIVKETTEQIVFT